MLWDTRTHGRKYIWPEHHCPIEAVAFSPEGALLATGDCHGTVYLRDVISGKEVRMISTWDTGKGGTVPQGRVWRLRFDRSGKLLVAAGDHGAVVWRVKQLGKQVVLTELRRFRLPLLIDLALRPQGDGAVVLDRDARVHALDLTSENPPRLLRQFARVEARSLEFDPSGERFTFVTPAGGLATCTWREGRVRATTQPASTVAISSTGRWVATAVAGRGVAVYDLELGDEWLTLPPDRSDVWGLAWSPDGRHIAVGLSDGDIAIWNLEEVRSCLAPLGITVPSTAHPVR
jgi:WD40 repeat protein